MSKPVVKVLPAQNMFLHGFGEPIALFPRTGSVTGTGQGHGNASGYGIADGVGYGEGCTTGDGLINGEGRASGLTEDRIIRDGVISFGGGLGEGGGTMSGDGGGNGYATFVAFSVQGTENALGVFFVNASVLEKLPDPFADLDLQEYNSLVHCVLLAKKLGLEAKLIVGEEELCAS